MKKEKAGKLLKDASKQEHTLEEKMKSLVYFAGQVGSQLDGCADVCPYKKLVRARMLCGLCMLQKRLPALRRADDFPKNVLNTFYFLRQASVLLLCTFKCGERNTHATLCTFSH